MPSYRYSFIFLIFTLLEIFKDSLDAGRGPEVSNSLSYLRGSLFKSQPEDLLLPWFSTGSSRKFWDNSITARHRLIYLKS
jgi:hypothetical protein